MAIQWGSYDNHLRVGIDISQSPSSVEYPDDQVTLTVKYYVQSDGWGWADNQTLTLTGHLTGSYTYTNNLTGDDHMLVVTRTLVVNLSGSTQSKSFTAAVSGAYNGANPTKTRSWTVPAEPEQPYTTPTAPGTPILSQGGTGTSITATVAAPSSNGGDAITNYQFQIATNSGFTTGLETVNNGTSRTKTWTGRALNTTYYVRARAQNSAGYGPYSVVSDLATFALPGAPTGVTAINPTPVSTTVDWVAPASNGGSPLTAYEIQKALLADFSDAVTQVTDWTVTELAFSNLLPNTTYRFRVRSKTAVGASAWSTVLVFTTSSLTYYKKAGLWKPIVAIYVKKAGVWKQVDKVFIKRGGTWTD